MWILIKWYFGFFFGGLFLFVVKSSGSPEQAVVSSDIIKRETYPLPPVIKPFGSDYDQLCVVGTCGFQIESYQLKPNRFLHLVGNKGTAFVNLDNMLMREMLTQNPYLNAHVSNIDVNRVIISGSPYRLLILTEKLAAVSTPVIYEPGHPPLSPSLPSGTNYGAIEGHGDFVSQSYLESGFVKLLLQDGDSILVHPSFLVLEPWTETTYYPANDYGVFVKLKEGSPHYVVASGPATHRAFKSLAFCLQLSKTNQEDTRSWARIYLDEVGSVILTDISPPNTKNLVRLTYNKPGSLTQKESFEIPLDYITFKGTTAISNFLEVYYSKALHYGVTIQGNPRSHLAIKLREMQSDMAASFKEQRVLIVGNSTFKEGDTCIDLLRDVVDGDVLNAKLFDEKKVIEVQVTMGTDKKHTCIIPMSSVGFLVNDSIDQVKIMYDPGDSILEEGVFIEGGQQNPLYSRLTNSIQRM